MEVAVKTLKTKTNVAALKGILSELKIMACVGKHSNIVNLVGACTKRMRKGRASYSFILRYESYIYDECLWLKWEQGCMAYW